MIDKFKIVPDHITSITWSTIRDRDRYTIGATKPVFTRGNRQSAGTFISEKWLFINDVIPLIQVQLSTDPDNPRWAELRNVRITEYGRLPNTYLFYTDAATETDWEMQT